MLLSISILKAQNEAPNKTDAAGKKQGHWIKFDANHKKLYDGNFVNDIPTGKFVYFYDTGVPRSITVFSQNGKVARTQMFSNGGKLSGEGKYVNEKKDSIWKFYDGDGKFLSDEIYINGLKNGIAKVYYSNGQVAEEKLWKDGIANGACTKYFQSGELKYRGNFFNGKVEGKVVFYHPNGKIYAEGIYKNDLKEGTWNFYKEDGSLEKTDVYVDGRGKNADKTFISKEEEDKAKKENEQFDIKDPYQEAGTPK